MKRLSGIEFAARQEASLLWRQTVPCYSILVLALMTTVIPPFAFGWKWLGLSLGILCSASYGAGYLLEFPRLIRAGLMPTPRPPYSVTTFEESIDLQTKDYRVQIDFKDVESARWVVDPGFDGFVGWEDKVLLLFLRGGDIVRIPGTSPGTLAVSQRLESIIGIARVEYE